MNIIWTIISTDLILETMVVEFDTIPGQQFNIRMPPISVDANEWLSGFYPRTESDDVPIQELPIGYTGNFDVEPLPPQQWPGFDTFGKIKEDELRAFIYQVIQEIKDSSV